MKGLEQETTRRRETALLELFDYTRQIRDELDLETRALAGHAHREHVRHSAPKTLRGLERRTGFESVFHTSESHTSS